jgi:hypothetical protein
VHINYKPAICLCDTGAVVSCISESFAKYLRLKPLPMTQDFKLVSANGSQIRVIGEADVEISIQGLVIPWTMYVVSSLSHNVILAQDFLQSTDAVIDCANRSLALYDGLVRVSSTRNTDRDTFFRLTQDVIFPPRTEAIVKMHVPKRFINKTSLLETFAPIKNKLLLVAGALVHPTENTTICRVINTGKTPRRLRAKHLLLISVVLI